MIKIQITQSCLVSNQLKGEIYVSEISDQVVVVKYPSVAKETNMDTTFLDCSTVPTLQRTHFKIGSCATGESA